MHTSDFGQHLNWPPGLQLTPYALGILSQYADVSPWYCEVRTTMTNVTREHKVVSSTPFDYDVLIIGAHWQGTTASNGQNVMLQVSDLASGRLWTVPGAIPGTPPSSLAGVNGNPMPVVQLPEAFFLQGGVALKHEWKTFGLVNGGELTWIGLALRNPISGHSAEAVVMPDGRTIPIGTRLPWFNTIGIGEEISVLGSPFYGLGVQNQMVASSSAMDWPVWVTGLSANWFTQNGSTTNPQNLLVSISDKGQPRMWTPRKGPATALFGSPLEAFPVMPFTQPYYLRPGDKLDFSFYNGNVASLDNAYFTIHGVQEFV